MTRRPPWLRSAVQAGQEFHQQRQPVLWHNLLNLSCLSILLSLTVLLVWLGLQRMLPPVVYLLLAAPLLGVLLFSYFVLVIHECSHGMFLRFSSPPLAKKWNHRIGRLAGSLLFTDYENHWERGHQAHHIFPTDPARDPQNPEPLDGEALLRALSQLLIPGRAALINPSRAYPMRPARLLLSGGLWGGLVLLGLWEGSWELSLSVVYAFNATAALNLLKIAQEHGSGLSEEADPLFRSRSYFYPLRWLLSPFNINYHWEHHANMSVPWYLLPAYRRRVLGLMPLVLQPHYETRGWRQYRAQLLGQRPGLGDDLVGLQTSP